MEKATRMQQGYNKGCKDCGILESGINLAINGHVAVELGRDDDLLVHLIGQQIVDADVTNFQRVFASVVTP